MGFNYAKFYLKAHVRHVKWFSGRVDIENADAVGELVQQTGAKRLLDFGSGKGYQYLNDRIHERWGGILPHCYDVGVWQLRIPPAGPFDGVICTDVMEHIAQKDVDPTIKYIMGFLRTDRPTFIYFNVFCNPASKVFPDGQNVHLTVKPPEWWEAKFNGYRRPGLTIRTDYEYMRDHHLQP